jgi:hypothetical protein
VLGAFARVLLTFREVRLLDRTRRQDRVDELTGLPNRRTFYSAITGRLGATPTQPMAVLMVDLDRFKEVNDFLGHGYGDELSWPRGCPAFSPRVRRWPGSEGTSSGPHWPPGTRTPRAGNGPAG